MRSLLAYYLFGGYQYVFRNSSHDCYLFRVALRPGRARTYMAEPDGNYNAL